jgi:hypothetical protein
MFIHLVGNRDPDAMTSQLGSNFAAAVGFVTHEATRLLLRWSSSAAFDWTTGH